MTLFYIDNTRKGINTAVLELPYIQSCSEGSLLVAETFPVFRKCCVAKLNPETIINVYTHTDRWIERLNAFVFAGGWWNYLNVPLHQQNWSSRKTTVYNIYPIFPKGIPGVFDTRMTGCQFDMINVRQIPHISITNWDKGSFFICCNQNVIYFSVTIKTRENCFTDAINSAMWLNCTTHGPMHFMTGNFCTFELCSQGLNW